MINNTGIGSSSGRAVGSTSSLSYISYVIFYVVALSLGSLSSFNIVIVPVVQPFTLGKYNVLIRCFSSFLFETY